jgi:hypothetical protein
MGKKLYSPDVLKEAISACEAWKQIDEELAFGKTNVGGLAADIQAIYQMQNDLATLEVQLTEMRGRRDDLYLSAWDTIKRLRSGVKGLYGDDSVEYELVGGTRRSERKRPRRTPAPE